MTRPSLLPALAVLGTILPWAAAFPAIGLALREIDPLPLAAVRFALAALIAAAWLTWRRPRGLSARDYAVLLVCGFVGVALYNVLVNFGQTTVSAGAASFLVNTQPIFTAALAILFLGEAFDRWSWLGAGLGLVGVALIAVGQPGGISFGAGSSLILAAAVCAATQAVLLRSLLARADPIDLSAFVLVVGAAVLLPWLPAGVAQAGAASGQAMAVVLFLAIASAVIGQTAWTYVLRSFGAARAGQFLYLIPPLAVAMAWPTLGEAPHGTTLAGGALALAGVVVVNARGRARRPAEG